MDRVYKEGVIKHYLTIDLEDWYHGHYPGYNYHSHSFSTERVTTPTYRILDMLDESGQKATFFALGLIAQKYPSLIKEIYHRGHELACHGWDHDLIDSISEASLMDWMKRNKSTIENITGQRVFGFRAPNFSVTNSNLERFLFALKECGFTYDSSIYSGKLFYGGIKCSSDLTEIMNNSPVSLYPISSGRFCGTYFPLGGFYFRFLPLKVFQNSIVFSEKKKAKAVFYFHPKDIDDLIPNLPSFFFNNVIHKIGTKNCSKKLSSILHSFSWQPICLTKQ